MKVLGTCRLLAATAMSVAAVLLTSACAGFDIDGDQNPPPVRSLTSGPRDIFVFFDGTGNSPTNPLEQTNVYRLFKAITNEGNPTVSALYLRGVGSALGGDAATELAENVAGKNMQTRIVAGYRFLASEYREGDRVFVFGFSRGALQARALAGWLAYTGVPELNEAARAKLASNVSDDYPLAKRLLKLSRAFTEEEYTDDWSNWKEGDLPPMAPIIFSELDNTKVKAVPVEFLGVWDTVPGSQVKDYGTCIEQRGVLKRNFHHFGISRGERYKILRYPSIKQVAHAVALNEARSKFKPVLVCNAQQTAADGQITPDNQDPRILQVTFPGAHSDVGGGYPPNTEFDAQGQLSNLSYNWMLDALKPFYKAAANPKLRLPENPAAMAHWSIGDSPGNTGSDCAPREMDQYIKALPEHPSVKLRREASPVPIRNILDKEEIERKRPYPELFSPSPSAVGEAKMRRSQFCNGLKQ